MSIINDPDYQKKYNEYNFKGRRKDEEIIIVLRRHWIVLISHLIPMLFFLLGIIFFDALLSMANNYLQWNVNEVFFSLIEAFLFLLFWVALFIVWIDYYLDVWIITNQRIINIEQIGLFSRQVSELEHGKIQDVTSEVKGLLPTFFKFGYVYIQTAGEKARFTFKQVPNPVRVRDIIMQLQKYVLLIEKKREGEILRGKI